MPSPVTIPTTPPLARSRTQISPPFSIKTSRDLKLESSIAICQGLIPSGRILMRPPKSLSDLGAHVERAEAFDPQHAVGVYTIVQRAEVSSNLGRYDGIRFGNDRSFLATRLNAGSCLAPLRSRVATAINTICKHKKSERFYPRLWAIISKIWRPD